MATFNNFFRVNTDNVSVLVQESGASSLGTELFAKTIRVEEDGSALVTSGTGTNIIGGTILDTLIGATGNVYIYMEVVGRGPSLAATDGVKVLVKNLSTAPAGAVNNTSYHTLVELTDNLVLPWNVATADTDTDKFPTLDAGLTVAAAAGKYVDIYVAVYYNA